MTLDEQYIKAEIEHKSISTKINNLNAHALDGSAKLAILGHIVNKTQRQVHNISKRCHRNKTHVYSNVKLRNNTLRVTSYVYGEPAVRVAA